MKKPIRYLSFLGFILLLLLSQSRVFAQGSSNKGTDFWLGYGNHISTGNMVLYLTSDVNTTATVTIPGISFSQTVTITANAVSFVDIPTSAHLSSDGKSSKGIHITALKPIIAYAHIYQSSVSGATLVLPVNTLGKDYYSINYKQVSNSNNSSSWFFVVAVEDDTQVEITPSQATLGGWAANSTHTVSLNKGEIYNVMGTFTNTGGNSYGVDLTGSRIKSISSNGTCKKIAVFSGSSKISINCLAYTLPTSGNPAPGSADNLFQQVYPTSTWGKNFITIPQKDRNFVVYRIIKSDPSAVITLNGSVVTSANFVNSFYYDFASQQTDVISSDKPIQVVQYAVTQNKSITCGSVSGDVGDPEMIFLNPLEQTLKEITMYSTPRFSITKHFINVVVKNQGVSSFKLDGNNVSSSFTVVPGNTAYSFAQLSVAEGTHNLSSDVGFNAIAYGFGNADSYGYAAGANLSSFGIEPINASNNESALEGGCVDVAYDFILKLPYEAVDLYLDKGDGNGYVNIPVKLLSQSTTDGVTTYVYSLLNSLKYNSANTYFYKVRAIKPTIDDCGTGDEFTYDFIINPKPVASFTAAAKICFNQPVSFTYQEDASEPNIVEYLWNFNGEATSNIKNPTYTFKTPGIKKVKFSTKSKSGCWSDVFDKEIEVVSLPTVKFAVSAPYCETKQVNFTDQSTTTNGTISQWKWDFGDPTSSSNTSVLQNPSHVYSVAGNYNVKLISITDLGCADTLVKQIVISPQPVADFTTPNICLDDASAQFANTSTIADNSALTYLWNFGDPTSVSNTSTLKNPSHKYLAAANYNVKLTVTSTAGCVTEITKVFTVNGSTPKSLFTVQNESKLCSDQIITFEERSTVDFGEITRIDWYFDDATPNVVETDNQPANRADAFKLYTHQYPTFYSPAQRTVNVKMVTYSGNSATCTNTITKAITLNAVPKVDFSMPNSCLSNGDAQFTNLSTYLGLSNGMTYSWDFGDGVSASSKSSDQNPVHHYTAAGNYTVTLTIVATNGCSATISKVFKVNGAIANPDFSVANSALLCSNQKVQFTDASTIGFGEINKIEWYFDVDNFPSDVTYQLVDNSPSKRNEVMKTYEFTYPTFNAPLTKNVNVKMKVFSGTGCESEIIKTITLKEVPKVVFNVIPQVCEEKAPYLITQASEVTGFQGTGIYSGKGINSNGLFSPYTAGVGTHIITYTFTGANGCEDSKTQNITVNPTPSADAGADHIILIGGEIKLDAVASGRNVTYKWSPASGLDQDNVLNPIASPVEDTKYTLTVTSEDGCVISDDVFVKVLKYPEIPNTFTPNGDGVNDTWAIKYLDSYPSSTIKIFNRYGKEVFKADRYTEPWDGKINGIDVPTGSYYYIITANNGSLKYTGSVLLVR